MPQFIPIYGYVNREKVGNKWFTIQVGIKILDGAERLIFARIAGLKEGNNDVGCTAENGRCFSQPPGNFRRNHASQMETRPKKQTWIYNDLTIMIYNDL